MLHKFTELKPGWFIRRPYWMTDMDMFHWRFDLIAIALAVSGGLQVLSTVKQGQAARRAGETQEAIAQRDALLAERQAEAEQQAAVAEARKQEREGKALKGRQRAAIAKAGVVGGRGTPLALLVETAEVLEAERLTILREGAISASQRRQQAGILRVQGAAAAARGRAASRAATLSAAGTILSTVGTVGQSRFERGLKPFSPGKR